MATVEELNKQYVSNTTTKYGGNADTINQMYDANKASQLAGLESAYNQNLSNQNAAMEKITPAYQQRANDLAVQYERNKRNLNNAAAARGLNTGTATQAALAQSAAYGRDYGNLRVAQQNALNEAERGINDLKANYQSQVQQATATNDFERAQALLSDYKTQYQNQLTLAANLAKYGDFSGYSGIYDDAQIAGMKQNWIASNPDLAYRTGNITGQQYYNMTGKYPAGYSAGGGGGGGYYGGGYNNRGRTSSQIREIQNILNRYDNAGLVVDGALGPLTEKAYSAASEEAKEAINAIL